MQGFEVPIDLANLGALWDAQAKLMQQVHKVTSLMLAKIIVKKTTKKITIQIPKRQYELRKNKAWVKCLDFRSYFSSFYVWYILNR